MVLNYIIPVCNLGGEDFGYRVSSLNFTLKNFLSKQSGVDTRVIIVEQICDTSLDTFFDHLEVPDKGDHFECELIQVEYSIFVKPWLYNIGMKHAIGEHVIISESDVYSEKDFFKDFLVYASDKRWCFIWEGVKKLSRERTRKLFSEGVVDDKNCYAYLSSKEGIAGMGVYFKKSFWWDELHGANEYYQELGANDNELALRAFHLTGEEYRYPLVICHLYHPMPGTKLSKKRALNLAMSKELKDRKSCEDVCALLGAWELGGEWPLEMDEELRSKFVEDYTPFKGILLVDDWERGSVWWDRGDWVDCVDSFISNSVWNYSRVFVFTREPDQFSFIPHKDITMIKSPVDEFDVDAYEGHKIDYISQDHTMPISYPFIYRWGDP